MEAEIALLWLNDLGKSISDNMDGLSYTLVTLVMVDYTTGVCVAVHNKQLSSDAGAHRIARRITIFALISLSGITDCFLLGPEDVLRTMTTVFYIASEAMSILENAGKVGLPLSQKLQNFLSHFEKYQGSRE